MQLRSLLRETTICVSYYPVVHFALFSGPIHRHCLSSSTSRSIALLKTQDLPTLPDFIAHQPRQLVALALRQVDI